MSPVIDPDRLLGDLRELATIGAYKSGVHRPTFSPQDVEARHWFARRLEEAGLEAQIDGIGSVFGFSRAAGPRILTGSHVESQNYAGWLDGPLGIFTASKHHGRSVTTPFETNEGRPILSRSHSACASVIRRHAA